MITGLAHVAIFTEDMDKSIHFYEALGAKLDQTAVAQKPKGENKLALLRWAGFTLELIEPHDGTVVTSAAGPVPHFAVQVEQLEQTVAQIRAAGIDTFRTETANVLPNVFGGLKNWYFTGPSGEQIELLQMGV